LLVPLRNEDDVHEANQLYLLGAAGSLAHGSWGNPTARFQLLKAAFQIPWITRVCDRQMIAGLGYFVSFGRIDGR